MAEASEVDSVVSEECIQELLGYCNRGSYKAKSMDRRNEIVHKMCIHLIARDYDVEVIDNKSGQLCDQYPSELIVIESQKNPDSTPSTPSGQRVNNTAQLKELITAARFARCRSRFVMPVLLYNDKNICRSATLSTMAEMYGRAGMDWIFTAGGGGGEATGVGVTDRASTEPPSPSLPRAMATSSGSATDSKEAELMTKVRGQDVQLLKTLGIELICDLMVEKKKSKYGFLVASSEKVDKWARYCDFQIASMPYPGCEFFREYKDNSLNPVGLHFDWSQSMIDADLLIPDSLQQLTQIQFKSYQDWDLVQITKNYLRLFLSYIQQQSRGSLLIHCISGWDRTPLFICLLRLSLWADGKAHCSLTAKEMLYFTLAYDWLTFGHPFKERHDKGEEIMFFCFDFLKYITSEEFSVNTTPRPPLSSVRDRSQCDRHSASFSASGSTYRNTTHPPSSSAHGHCSSTELGESWAVEGMPSTQSSGLFSESWQHVSQEWQSSGRYSSSTSQHNSLLHSGSSSRYHENQSLPPVPEVSPLSHTSSHSYSQTHSDSLLSHSLLPASSRVEKLLAVRSLFQSAYRAAVPETQAQGAMAFATGWLSKLTASFGGGGGDTQA